MPGKEWPAYAGGALILLLALFLRVYQIGQQELWFDESFSYHLATISGAVARNLRHENTPPLYYLLLRAWVKVAGTSEAALRLPSAMFGTLFVGAVIWAGRTFFNVRVGLWSGLFAAVAPLHVYYSQEARTYSLLTLLLLLTYVLLWRALERNTGVAWLLVTISGVLTLYSHYFAVFGLLPTVFLVWMWPERDRRRAHWVGYGAAAGACLLLFLPWALWCFVMTRHEFALWPHPAPTLSPPPWVAVARTLEVFGLGSQAGLQPRFAKIFPELVFPQPLRLIALATLLGLGLWASVSWGDRALGIHWLARRKAWLWLLLFVPLGAIRLVFVFKPIDAAVRYEMAAFPAYALLTGLAIAKTQAVRTIGRFLAPGVALALFIPIAVKLALYYEVLPPTSDPKLSARTTAYALTKFVDPGDVVVFTGVRALPVLYYLERVGYRWEDGQCRHERLAHRFACRSYPAETELYLGAERTPAPPHSVVQEFIGQLRGPDNVVWVAFNSGVTFPDRFGVADEDEPLVNELRAAGFTPVWVPMPGAPLMFQFRPPTLRGSGLSGSTSTGGMHDDTAANWSTDGGTGVPRGM